MIIYGWRSVQLKSSQSRTSVCPYCKNKGSITTSFYSTYAHIFWIPLFPYRKSSETRCQECSCIISKKNMTDEIRMEYNDLKRQTRIPLWQFIGIVAITIAIALAIESDRKEKALELEYIGNPEIGDVLEYKTETNNFSTLKIVEVSQDSIIFIQNAYEISEKSGVKDIEADSCYFEDLYIMARTKLDSMYNENVIYDINRK